jgi:acyl dehydratase
MNKEHWGYKEVGYKFATGTTFVTATDLDTFCNITGMREDIFLDDEAAKAVGARLGQIPKGRIVPGAFQLAIVFTLLGKTGLIEEGVFLGTNNMKLNAMVYPYDRLRLEGELHNRRVTSDGNRVIVVYSWFLKNQNDVIVCQGENTCIFPNPKKP